MSSTDFLSLHLKDFEFSKLLKFFNDLSIPETLYLAADKDYCAMVRNLILKGLSESAVPGLIEKACTGPNFFDKAQMFSRIDLTFAPLIYNRKPPRNTAILELKPAREPTNKEIETGMIPNLRPTLSKITFSLPLSETILTPFAKQHMQVIRKFPKLSSPIVLRLVFALHIKID